MDMNGLLSQLGLQGEGALVAEVFVVVFVTVLVNFVALFLLKRVVKHIENTRNYWDDALVLAARKPLSVLIWLLGISWAAEIIAADTQAAIFEAVGPIREVTVVVLLAWFVVSFIQRAEDHLKALARKGVIEIVSGTSRGIRLLTEAEPEPEGLPIVGRVAAGSPILAEQHIEQYADVQAQLFSPPADFLLRVHGDSMIDVGIFDDDLVAVKNTQTANNGEIVVARIEDEVTVKRFQKNKGEILLVAENENYDPIRVDQNSGDFAIEGLVVGVIRNKM